MTLQDALAEIDDLKGQLNDAHHEIDKLHRLLKQAQKNLYGSKSEKQAHVDTQEVLFSFKAEAQQQPLEQLTEIPRHQRRVSNPRKELPSEIERQRIEYDLDDKRCGVCDEEMPVIGEDTTRQLEYVPARFKILEHVRLKRACPCCKQGVFIPKLPLSVQPLERSQPGPGLLAQIIIAKFQDHLPLHRQEQIFGRHGIDLPRQRMCDWLAASAQLLEPIYFRIVRRILERSYFQADETTLKVQDDAAQKLHTGYLWAVRSPPEEVEAENGTKQLLPEAVAYHYAPQRAAEVPKELFKHCKATVQTDAYAGYNPVFVPEHCRRLACMAHIRRKFVEAEDTAKTNCSKILKLIAELYQIESQLKNTSAAERKKVRLKKSFPVLVRLYRLIRSLRRTTLPQAALSKALEYTWSQRCQMLRYLRDGRFEIDNNAIERQMRPVALGRKNYLFAGSHDGARRAALFYTLLNTCKLNKVNPHEWLRHVFIKIHEPGRLDDLLPQNWKALKTLA